MITASHNPPIFNGFKLKSHYGGSSDSETCKAVEGFLDKNPVAAGASPVRAEMRKRRARSDAPTNHMVVRMSARRITPR